MRTLSTFAALTLIAAPLAAQQDGNGSATKTDSATTPAAAPAAKPSNVPPITISRLRPADKRGINVFEAPKSEDVPFTGFKVGFGAAFTQQFQGLGHENTAAAKVNNGVNANQLINVGHGFPNAVANAYLNAQLAKGVRVAMTAYLSSRHHSETWVKDGYLLIDESPIDFQPLNTLMKYTSVRAGHFEINYGDGHFRRTDNGNAMYNPLVGNYILDAFTTQVGGEVYLHGGGPLKGAFAMGAITNGEVRGMVLNAAKRSPAFYGKAGIDRQVSKDLRVRLTSSLFSQTQSANQTLYSGDRAGSRYYNVLENSTATEAAQAWSGAIRPFGGNAGIHAAVVNPFIKFRGLEYFGSFEQAKGRAMTEASTRTVKQTVNELTYRFLKNENLYVSGRYNTLDGREAGMTSDIKVQRSQIGGGWFITPVVLMKGEWVNQKYLDFPTTDIRSGGKFKGFMIEAVVAF